MEGFLGWKDDEEMTDELHRLRLLIAIREKECKELIEKIRSLELDLHDIKSANKRLTTALGRTKERAR